MDIDIDKYVVTESDYFREGCTTILNSLEAAITRAAELYKEIPEDGMFNDPDFGPQGDDDMKGSWLSMYFEEKVPAPGYTPADNVEWLRPSQYSGQIPQFIADDTSANDVV